MYIYIHTSQQRWGPSSLCLVLSSVASRRTIPWFGSHRVSRNTQAISTNGPGVPAMCTVSVPTARDFQIVF
jgi:hypothetical protein